MDKQYKVNIGEHSNIKEHQNIQKYEKIKEVVRRLNDWKNIGVLTLLPYFNILSRAI